MKQQFLFGVIVFLLFAERSNAQTNVYHAMPDSNATWCEMQTYGVTCGIEERYLLTIGRDTIINSLVYHQMVASGYRHCLSSYVYYTNEYRGAFREDTAQRKVYWIIPNVAGENVLYDFTLAVGDTTPMINNWGPGMVITSVDSVLVGTSYRKSYTGVLMSTNDTARIVEGVGSDRGFYELNMQYVEFSSHLNEFTEGSTITFVPPGWTYPCGVFAGIEMQLTEASFVISPNPNNGLFTLSFEFAEAKDVRVEMVDVAGRVISSTDQSNVLNFKQEMGDVDLANGVYFLRIATGDGVVTKKVVVKK